MLLLILLMHLMLCNMFISYLVSEAPSSSTCVDLTHVFSQVVLAGMHCKHTKLDLESCSGAVINCNVYSQHIR